MQQSPITSTTQPGPSTVPQFVVIHDQMQQSWKHPIVHYVFEDEPFPSNAPKDRCILVNLKEDGESVADCYSFSHTFQVSNYKISSTPQMNTTGTGSKESSITTSLMLTIEGMSAKNSTGNNENQFGYKEEFDQSSNVFELDELVYDYKRRNELIRQLFT
ncbi:hypothetical protein C2G38_2124750 [Gigaspora rosea]|uniref:Uncharacterized protein n=1 Tax=Gigaspora rosea TaxID=44941 RepID=A0A397TXB4_9GLOM|nr:hypothetical protein C2G38_2124750 [Gigaspora rosea]